MSQGRNMSNSQQSRIHESRGDKKSDVQKQRITSLNSPNQKKLNYNFTVAVRVRPHIPSQYTNINKQMPHLQYETPNKNVLVMEYPQGTHHSYFASKHRKFNFDHIFIRRSNRDIYQQLVKPKLAVLKQNINLTVLTYGITGSGKTHTIFGKTDLGQQGLVMMCFQDVMKQLGHQDMRYSFCFMQIYNEQVHDLLREQYNSYDATGEQPGPKLKAMNVMQDSKGRINIPELTKMEITSSVELRKLVEKGNATRASSSNLINKLSSRSHALMQLFCFNQKTKIQNIVTIIDLAGSERHASVFNGNETLSRKSMDKENKNLQKEGSNINRSLLALGSCIKGLENGQAHIPYRDSKLTRILKEDLSGKAQNIMIACVGTNFSQVQETINTLNYASRAANIKVEKFSNSPIHNNFQCSFCYKLTPWKEVIKRMPAKIMEEKLKQQKAEIKKQIAKVHQDPQQLQNLNLSRLIKNYKVTINQQYNNIRRQILGLIQSLQIYSTQTFSTTLNNFQNERNVTQKQKIYSKVNNIFDFYEVKITKELEYDLQNLRDRSQKQIIKQFYESCGNHKSSLFGREDNSSPRNKSYSQAPLYRNNAEYLINNSNFTLQSYRQQALNDLNQTCGNLRKKINLKNNKDFLNSANTTNATLSDFHQIYHCEANNGQIKRMSPDVEQQSQPTQRISYKKAIITKIEEAKKKCRSQLQLDHENYPRFQCQQLDNQQYLYTLGSHDNQKRQAPKSFIKIKQDELEQICVSSFTEESNQYQACC